MSDAWVPGVSIEREVSTKVQACVPNGALPLPKSGGNGVPP